MFLLVRNTSSLHTLRGSHPVVGGNRGCSCFATPGSSLWPLLLWTHALVGASFRRLNPNFLFLKRQLHYSFQSRPPGDHDWGPTAACLAWWSRLGSHGSVPHLVITIGVPRQLPLAMAWRSRGLSLSSQVARGKGLFCPQHSACTESAVHSPVT